MMPSFEEMLALAEQRAAMEVETWIPEKPGDRIAGIVTEVGSISTKFGDYYTTTLDTGKREYIENGTPKQGATDKYIRVAWMGAVLKSQFERMVPCPGDMVAFHYQKDMTPANGKEDYALINSMVIDSKTGQAKMPVNLSVHVPSVEQVMNADPRTGELARTWEPLPNETPFPDDDASGPSSSSAPKGKSEKS